MTPKPENIAREEIDRMLAQAGWNVQDVGQANIYAHKGVALREFPLKTGFGLAPFAQQGGLGRAYRILGDNLNKMLDARCGHRRGGENSE
jgi:hypothetical protein